MEELFGFFAKFDRATVVHKDVYYFGAARSELIDLTVRYRQLNHMEVSIAGYDDDPRSLYEVPEARRWVKLIRDSWADSLFWLTPGSLWWYLLCLHPTMFTRFPNGKLEFRFETKQLEANLGMSYAVAENVLKKAGMPKAAVKQAEKQAIENYQGMLNQKKLGDYVVLHPKEHAMVTYSRKDWQREKA